MSEAIELIPETCIHDKILNCSFCGNEPEIYYHPFFTTIECDECGIKDLGHGPMSDKQQKEGICYLEIVGRWNNKMQKTQRLEAKNKVLSEFSNEVSKTDHYLASFAKKAIKKCEEIDNSALTNLKDRL